MVYSTYASGCRLLVGSVENGFECHEEEAGHHEEVIQEAGAHEEVGNKVDRADHINERPEHHKLRLKRDDESVGHALLTLDESFGFRNRNRERPIRCKLGKLKEVSNTT